MTETKSEVIFEVDQHITANSRYYAGRMGSEAYVRLRDEQKIMGARCDACNLVYWPPRSTCGRCFGQIPMKNLLEIGPEGTVETFTLVNYSEPIHPKKAPFILAVVKLDGADTGLTHYLAGIEFEQAQEGLRVRPVFKDERKGEILDIDHFEPVSKGA